MFLWRASGAAAYNEGNGGHRRSGSGGRVTGYESRVFAASRAEIADYSGCRAQGSGER